MGVTSKKNLTSMVALLRGTSFQKREQGGAGVDHSAQKNYFRLNRGKEKCGIRRKGPSGGSLNQFREGVSKAWLSTNRKSSQDRENRKEAGLGQRREPRLELPNSEGQLRTPPRRSQEASGGKVLTLNHSRGLEN